jgi:hypothetical protein
MEMGDHMFKGKWIGDEKWAKKGKYYAAVKALCGSKETKKYKIETKLLGAVKESATYTTIDCWQKR